MAGVLVSLAVLALWIYSLFDVITTPDEEIRNLPKVLWVLVIVLLPLIGSLFWFLLGRPLGPQSATPRLRPQQPQQRQQPAPPPPKGPDDDPDFLKDLERRMRGDD
ncbi:PLDc N-terminal domain-containing protein [Nonomuraea sp. NPDC050310]|uniref:PLDc N-terminal domain-containing protein n=1 Tax=unclassified Nonomuraea TaxID=2593643 RepID=UPI0033D004CD